MYQSLQVGQLGVVAKHVGGLVELVVDVVFHGLHISDGSLPHGRRVARYPRRELLRNGAQERLFLIGERLDAGNDVWLPLPSKPLASRIIHSTSTRMRSRFNAGSLKYSTSGAVC